MSIRSGGDVILACNMARDLGTMALKYVELFRKHINGENGLTIPDGDLFVRFGPQTKEGWLQLDIYKKSEVVSPSSNIYESSGYGSGYADDEGEPGYGRGYADDDGSSSYYRTVHSRHNVYDSVGMQIPLSNFLRDDLADYFAQREIKIRAEKAEAKRLAEIAELEEKLKLLKGNRE